MGVHYGGRRQEGEVEWRTGDGRRVDDGQELGRGHGGRWMRESGVRSEDLDRD